MDELSNREQHAEEKLKKNRSPFTTILVLTSILIILVVSACSRTTPSGPSSSTPTVTIPFDTPWGDRSIFKDGLILSEQALLNDLPGATEYHIDLTISADMLTLEGREEVLYTNREEMPLNEIYFQLFPNITGGKSTVAGVTVDGQSVEPEYEFLESAFRIPLPANLLQGESMLIEMDFTVDVVLEMAGNYGLFGYFDGVLVLDSFYPVIPVYNEEGWNVGLPPHFGDITFFDASFYLLRVTAPDDLIIVATGSEVAREKEQGKQIVTFAAGPARDFYLAASEDFIVASEQVGDTTINSYTLSHTKEGGITALQFASDATQVFNERFGIYPYIEMDLVSTPMQALGIEYPGIMGVALPLYDPTQTVSGLPYPILLESTVAHEVAHQWFYNVIGNDQLDEPWLDEALAQYVTGLYYGDVHGEAIAKDFRSFWDSRWSRIDYAEIPIGLPSEAYTSEAYSPIVYGRGPLFIAALAEEIGEGTFDQALRDYYQTHQWGIGTGASFREAVETGCQCDLTELFETWVYQ
jgi:hypothetical protein